MSESKETILLRGLTGLCVASISAALLISSIFVEHAPSGAHVICLYHSAQGMFLAAGFCALRGTGELSRGEDPRGNYISAAIWLLLGTVLFLLSRENS